MPVLVYRVGRSPFVPIKGTSIIKFANIIVFVMHDVVGV